MNFFEELKNYFEVTPTEKILQEWGESAEYDKVGIKVEGFLSDTIQISCTLEDPPKVTECYKTNINPKTTLGFLIIKNIYHAKSNFFPCKVPLR